MSLQPKSFPCRASLQESETWWASLDLRSVRGSTQRMGSAFYWPMDMGLLGSPSLISYFIIFSSKYKRKRKEEKEEKVEPKVETCVFLASSAKSFFPCLTLLPLKLLPTQATALGTFAFGVLDTKRKSSH